MIERFSYDDKVVRQFTLATLFFGVIAFLVGILAAVQMADWRFNFELPWLTFGRIRPLHTNAAVFAFAGNAIFAGIYYSTQRLCKARMFSDTLSQLHFWGWQLVILCAAISLPLGYTVSKEYAELEWPIDILITVVWVIFAVNFFGTLIRRRERHIYVALWFYIGTIVTVAVLHIVNSLALPVGFMKSYPIYAGAQDALVQWWYGHNAVAFFLTTPFLGLMYYYVPKAANRPVYSYRLSIIHFWALVFLYIWAGPHHLLYTALPEWAQTLGVIFSVMLWAPSWGGMINGLLTLRGAWHKLRTDPILKFFVAAITFYGMSTFEGPMLSIKSINGLAHYTDYIVGHVHGGTLGWNGLLTFGVIYYLLPKLYRTPMASTKLMEVHFWLGIGGTLLYMVAMWVAGITQGLMWQAMTPDGKLVYDFVETVIQIVPMYWLRALGGVMFFVGYLLMIYNVWATIKNAQDTSDETDEAPALESEWKPSGGPHRALEGLPMVFTVLSLIAILVGTVIEIVPTFTTSEFVPKDPKVRPLDPLEHAGRDIYVREGCYTCHSQMIRPMVHEVLRYGEPSLASESQYDRPHQWGSKRTGPDLARVGKKYPDLWHFRHMLDPRSVTDRSLMPAYPWLLVLDTDYDSLSTRLRAMKKLGVPYDDSTIEKAALFARNRAASMAKEMEAQGIPKGLENKEIMALIAYLQSLGQQRSPE